MSRFFSQPRVCAALSGAVFSFPAVLFAAATTQVEAIDPGLDPLIEKAALLKPFAPLGLYVLGGAIALTVALLAYSSWRRCEWARRASLCVLALGSFLFVLEMGLRLSWGHWAVPVKVRSNCYASNPRGYFVEQSMKDRPESRAYCVDGFESDWQDCEADRPRGDEGRLRILALGDSFTNGVGVFTKDRWPRQLEQRLAASPVFRGRPKPAVTNCGMVSLDTEQIADRYFTLGVRHEPQIVIYAYVLNDVPLRWPRAEREKPSEVDFQLEDRAAYFLRLSKDPLLGLFSDESALWRFGSERWLRARIANDTETMYVESYSAINGAAIASTLSLIEAMKQDAAARGARFLVAIYPLFYRFECYPFTAAHELLRQELDRRGIACVDLLPTFIGQDAAEYQVHPTDFHPNERAHARVAERLALELARRGWLWP